MEFTATRKPSHLERRRTRDWAVQSTFVALVISSLVWPLSASAAGDARFIGNLVLADFNESEGYKFRLVEPFEYLDPNGLRWRAEVGTVTDGASIPRTLWSVVGSPYTGLYRKAAIIHDFYCDKNHRYRPWKKVHRVFYDAMITAGVSKAQALLMYYAVWRFGPRWKIEEITNCRPGHICFDQSVKKSVVTTTKPIIDDTNRNTIEEELIELKKQLFSNNIEPDEIPMIAAKRDPVKFVTSKIQFDENSSAGRKYLRNLQAQ